MYLTPFKSLSPLTSPCSTPDHDRSTSPTPDQPTSPTLDQPTSPTPGQSRSTTSNHGNVEGPRRYPYRTISSAGEAPRVAFEPFIKVGLERPKGAGRTNLPRLLGWDDALHDAVKVRDFFFLLQYLVLIWISGCYTKIRCPTLKHLSSHEKDKGFKEAVGKLQACK